MNVTLHNENCKFKEIFVEQVEDRNSHQISSCGFSFSHNITPLILNNADQISNEESFKEKQSQVKAQDSNDHFVPNKNSNKRKYFYMF